MANVDHHHQDALKYRIRDVATTHAECDRFIAASIAPTGRFVDQANVEIKATAVSSDQFQVFLSRSVTGRPRDGDEPVAFAALCTVACVAEFSRKLNLDAIPSKIIDQIALSLFHISTERCRTMVTWMGFPAGPAVSLMPKFEIVKSHSVEGPPPSSAAKKARTTPRTSSKKTAKAS